MRGAIELLVFRQLLLDLLVGLAPPLLLVNLLFRLRSAAETAHCF